MEQLYHISVQKSIDIFNKKCIAFLEEKNS